MTRIYIHAEHWSQLPKDQWVWPNFSPQEMASRGNHELYLSIEAMDKLQEARNEVGKPFVINSAYRDPEYNKHVGGSENSEHIEGHAFDISKYGHSSVDLYAACVNAGFTGFGYYGTFLHVDIGRKRSWGDKHLFFS